MTLTTDQKGSIAEMAIAWEATRLGVCVLRPMSNGARYDLVLDAGQLLRVQCKWAVQRGDVVQVRCRTCRRGRDGFIRTCYTADEVDVIAAYCPDNDRCYLLPIEKFAGRTMVLLRISPTRNNQQKGVNWAEEFEFAATMSRLVGP
jgi:hypothetical protein